MKFNTAIAAMMTLINDIYDHGSLTRDELLTFAGILCPFAPHAAEEMWAALGGEGLCSVSSFPTWDEAKCGDKTVEIVVQLMGKVRAKLNVPTDISKEDAIAQAKEAVASMIEGHAVVKEIYVPGKLVNLVIK